MSDSVFHIPNLAHEDEFPVGEGTLEATAESWSGKAVSGHLIDFSAPMGILKIKPASDGSILSLKFNQVKRLKIDHNNGTDIHFLPTQVSGSGSSGLQSFAVFLRDGSVYSGICRKIKKLDEGLWLFPKTISGDGDPYRVFVPKSGIVRFEVNNSDEGLISDENFAHTVLCDHLMNSETPLETVENFVIDQPEALQAALVRQGSLKPVPIGQALLGLGKITAEQLEKVLELQKTGPGTPLGRLLLDKGLISESDLQVAFARKMGYPFVDLVKFPLDPNALKRVPLALALRLEVLPILDRGRSLVVAMADPLRFKVIDELEFLVQCKVVPVVGASGKLLKRIEEAYHAIGASGQAFAASSLHSLTQSGAGVDQNKGSAHVMQLAAELVGDTRIMGLDDTPIEQSDNTLVRLINSMIAEAYYQKASDIHIETYPGRDKVVVRFRVDGQMRPYLELPSSHRNSLIARIKIMCDLDISEKRKPQDGKINFFKFGQIPLELRVVTIPTNNGLEDVVLRLLSSVDSLPLGQLNLSDRNLKSLENLVQRPHGLLLCVGPTGSGKTTTLHSVLKFINTPNRKIWTAEDPVEITQKGLRQIQVNPKIGWTFAAALRSMLRADPDVVMVGEIRDHETAEMAIEASLTGHLVFSTLHTNSAAETVVRLIDLGVDSFSFSDSLQGILAQRLVRRFCRDCVQSEPLSNVRLQELIADYQQQLPEDHAFKSAKLLEQEWQQRYGKGGQLFLSHAPGCAKCAQTGYVGRVAVHELLVSSIEMRHLVQIRALSSEIQQQAMREGMTTLRQDGIEKVLQGLTSLVEVRSSTQN